MDAHMLQLLLIDSARAATPCGNVEGEEEEEEEKDSR